MKRIKYVISLVLMVIIFSQVLSCYECVWASGDIDITNDFTDPGFLAEVRKILGKGDSEKIYSSDVAEVTSIDISGFLSDSLRLFSIDIIYAGNIHSINGIEHFVNLKVLDCSYNKLTELDISKNTMLIELSCSDNQLTDLDISNNTALTWLSCSNNQLIELDTSNNTALTNIYCSNNQLIELDVSNNTELEELSCTGNKLTELDVFNNTELNGLWCYGNNLTKLDVSNNAALGYLDCLENNMHSPDVVIGWQEIGLVLQETFDFYPQNDGNTASAHMPEYITDSQLQSSTQTLQSYINTMTANLKTEPIEIDLLTLFAEEYISQAASTTVTGDISINLAEVQNLQGSAHDARMAAYQRMLNL